MFLKPAIDRDGAAYDEKRQRGDWLTYCRQCKRDGIDALDFETWRIRTDNGTLQPVDAALPTTTHNQPSSNTPPSSAQRELQPIDGTAAQPPAPARDSDGIVRISDADYEKLQTELGQPELDRVVGYLGRYCMETGKRYASWPAIIRRASTEGWGLSSKPSSGATKRTADFQPTLDRIQKNNDWLDRFLAEQAAAAKEGDT